MKDVYLIGNAHLDPVWLWQKAEGLSEILSTFRSALDRMKEFPNYIFTSACAGYYRWVEEIDPAMFAEIQARVKEGRWDIAGGMWVQPDCNLPSGEAFARHLLYSQNYFREKFGVAATVGYNVDSFGHNGMLPQLLQKGGIQNYVFMRPEEHENARLPSLFTWQSPDGSRVTTHRVALHYGDLGQQPEGLKEKLAKLKTRAEEEGHPTLCFYGVGNHGGGPTIRSLQFLEQEMQTDDHLSYAKVGDYFDDLHRQNVPDSLPLWQTDLQHHASGCYAANAPVKAANRRAENSLVKAEKYDLLAQRLVGAPASQNEITGAWQKVLFNQFHDILAGCSIRAAYTEALDAFSAACDTATEITHRALHRMAWQVCTTRGLSNAPCQKNGWALWEKEGEGAPVVVFNPHSFPVCQPVQLGLQVAGVADGEGKPVLCQTVRGPQTNGQSRYATLFMANLPAFGYAVYYIYQNPAFALPAAPEVGFVQAAETRLENDLILLEFDPATGSIVRFFDKEKGKELAAGPMAQAVVINDAKADTWAHGLFTFDDEVGRFADPHISVLEKGPLRAAVRVTTRYQNSFLQQDFLLTPHTKEVVVRCHMDFHEQLKIVKLTFPTAAADPTATYSMPYGFLTKEANGEEEPAHKWAAVADRATGEGLTLCNDGKYSFCATPCEGGAALRMAIARGSIFADHFGERDELVEYMDQGEQKFQYSLLPFTGDPEKAHRRAALLNTPPELLMETHHEGKLPGRYEGITISQPNVVLAAAKNAHNGRGVILRFVETAGRETEATVNAPFLGLRFSLHVRPQEIKTLRVEEGDDTPREVLLTEWEENGEDEAR